MAVLRLSDGSIWVHSPVSLDDDLAAALAEMGEVKHIVTPNYEHTKYAQQVQFTDPHARLPVLAPAWSGSASTGLLKHALWVAASSALPL